MSLPLKVARRLQRSRAVKFGDLVLPPPLLRLGGAHFRDDEAFVESGRKDVRKLREAFGVGRSSAILDIGCGVGRLPIGLLAEFGELADYTGADVDPSSIHWCKAHIEARHPNSHFVCLDVANDRYNRGGRAVDDSFRLPWDDGRFDVIFLYSVFSHMRSDDVYAYLQEFRRMLKPDGGVFLTAFVEADVPDIDVNPPGYGPLRWKGALHCVRYSSSLFEQMVAAAGFEISTSSHGSETDGQSAMYLRPRSADLIDDFSVDQRSS